MSTLTAHGMTTKAAAIRASREASAGRAIEDYPIALDAHHMAEIFGKSLKRFYALEAAGAFDWALTVAIGGTKSWSRDRVKAYFAGELDQIPAFRELRKKKPAA